MGTGPKATGYQGGVLLPDGRVVLVPGNNANTIGLYDPSIDTFKAGPHVGSGGNKHTHMYRGGVLLPDGRVVFAPGHTKTVGLYDPRTNIFVVGPDTGRY